MSRKFVVTKIEPCENCRRIGKIKAFPKTSFEEITDCGVCGGVGEIRTDVDLLEALSTFHLQEGFNGFSFVEKGRGFL